MIKKNIKFVDNTIRKKRKEKSQKLLQQKTVYNENRGKQIKETRKCVNVRIKKTVMIIV